MKRRWILGYILLLSLLAGCAVPQTPVPTQLDQISMLACLKYSEPFDKLRDHLLAKAKRLALDALYGEEIRIATQVTNFVVTEDQIKTSTAGKLRLLSMTEPASGTQAGDVCLTAVFYTTEEDRQIFTPKRVQGIRCNSTDRIPTDRIKDETERAAEIEALHQFDTRLRQVPDEKLLHLLQNVKYTENVDLPSFCVSVEAMVRPIVVDVLLETNTSGPAEVSPSVSTSAETVTATAAPSSVATETPMTVPTATPSLVPTATATPALTATSTPMSRATATRPLPTNTHVPPVWSPPTLLSPGSSQTVYRNAVSSIVFHWSGGTSCIGSVTCTLSIDRMQGNNVEKWAVVSKQVQGQQVTLDVSELAPGDYQWTIVLFRGQERMNPVPQHFRVEDNRPSNQPNSPLSTPISPLPTRQHSRE